MPIVASDFDGTLTTGEMWRGVARYVREHGRGATLRRFLLARLPRMVMMRLGVGDQVALRSRFMEQLPQVTAGFSTAQVDDLAQWVVEQELWPKRRQPILDELEGYRQQGKRILVVSGAYQPILQAFADRIHAEAIGTPLAFKDGQLTGALAGALNVGAAKAERLRAVIGAEALDVAYGDTQNDIPMLSLAKAAVVVNPDAALRSAALAQGWRVIEDVRP
jgi:phosphoserine phosphatase